MLPSPGRIRALLAHGAAIALGAALLAAAGQPLFTDDAWWHLALGRAFAESGPRLGADPLLFDAAAPPSPSAWLFDLGLFGAYELLGFAGLRALHAAAVASVLALAWSLLRRASGSALVASAGTAVFVALSAYRLVQLRPHLATIGLTLLLYRLLLEAPGPLGARRIAGAAALFALWANLHAAFPIGLAVLGGATCAAAAAAVFAGDPGQRSRARSLGLAWGVGCAATILNPQGLGAHAPWFSAGSDTPSLGRVVDEWAPVNPLSWPQPTLPPTPLSWALVWALLLGAAWLLSRVLARRGAGRLDPAQLGAAAVALAAMLSAVRFLWLGVLPLLQLARALGPRAAAGRRAAWVVAAAPAVCGLLFLRLGDWPLVTRALPSSAAGYAEPYSAHKYYADPVWMLRDAGVEGRLYCEYFQAGFVGFWLAPRVRTLVNGTLNVPSETLRAATALAARRGLEEDESFTALLDRLGIDLFLGIRPPETGNPWRPWSSTTAHLEDTPGWIPIFRNLYSSVHLRSGPRNRTNLQRVAEYYSDRGVPFDPQRGFDPAEALRAAPEWSLRHGLQPAGFAALVHRARHSDPTRAAAARDHVASVYAALGLYELALELDRVSVEHARGMRPRRRLVWSLLRLGRHGEAAEAAALLEEAPAQDALAHAIARLAREAPTLEPEALRTAVATLPVFYRFEVPRLLAGTQGPEARID